jgi:glucoamylase
LISQPQFFSSFDSAEQLYDALITWDKIGYIDVTPVSLKFWKQFDSRVTVKRHKKGSQGYKTLTEYVRGWANKIVLQLAKATPKDYVLVQCINKETGEPYGPRGMIRSLAAALGVMDAHKGLVPPNWGHPIPKSLESDEAFPVEDPPRIDETEAYRASPNVNPQQTFDPDNFRYRYANH